MAERSIGFGIIGLGRIGAFHAESLRSRIAGAHLVAAVVDPEHRARLLADGSAPCDLEETAEALLGRPDVEAVVIASPAIVHDEHITLAARASKPIFSEKPLADTVAKAEAAADAVRSAGSEVTLPGEQDSGIVRFATALAKGDVAVDPLPGKSGAEGSFVVDDGELTDLIVDAVHCTAEKMAFIVRHTSGIVCALSLIPISEPTRPS